MVAELQTIAELAGQLERREVSASAVVERCLEQIDALNSTLNAFITVLKDQALAQAQEADQEIARGAYRGPLHGVPISLKDIIDVARAPTTAASHVRKGHIASADAASVTRLRQAGAVFVGKTNLHEFALGTTNDESAFGPARHPLDPTRSPGGSSGGSAASVSAGMAYASLGTDTGGSIRIPSAACGLVGLKPTLGELSTAGVVPLSTTLDHVGPLCRSVQDAGILYDVLRGAKPHPSRVPSCHGLRLAVPRGYFFAVLDEQVATAFDAACERLRAAGAHLEDVRIAHTVEIGAIYTAIVLSEAAAYHAKTLATHADSYTPNVRMRLEMGRYILAEDYIRALRGRDVLRAEVDALLDGRDALLLPTLPIPAPVIGTTLVKIGKTDEPVRNVMLRNTQLFNVTGHPALAIPCGRTGDNMPVSAQVIGRTSRTSDLLRVGRALEPYLVPGASR